MGILKHLKDRIEGKAVAGEHRSDEWPRVRKEHLEKHPLCEVCGGDSTIEVHHIKAFSTHPKLELDPRNLITLCEAKKNGVSCHQLFGHLGDFHSINPKVRGDSKTWSQKIKNRKR